MKSTKNKWVVNKKGGPGSSNFEISVIRNNNTHGKQSYGWFGPDKLLITHNGGPCSWPLIKLVWRKQVALAEEVAAELNREEGN